jgi:hypothetical protein
VRYEVELPFRQREHLPLLPVSEVLGSIGLAQGGLARERFRLLQGCRRGASRQDQVKVAELVPEVAVRERGRVGALEELTTGRGLEQLEV